MIFWFSFLEYFLNITLMTIVTCYRPEVDLTEFPGLVARSAALPHREVSECSQQPALQRPEQVERADLYVGQREVGVAAPGSGITTITSDEVSSTARLAPKCLCPIRPRAACCWCWLTPRPE